MPKRTNPFQKLVLRIEKLLHGTAATVEESALVENKATGEKEEIDVLVSIPAGGRLYRVGIQATNKSRKASPDWIRNLAAQRTHCGLDRMIAVHGKGFSKNAKATAERENVELVVPSQFSNDKLLTLFKGGLSELRMVTAKVTELVFLPLAANKKLKGYASEVSSMRLEASARGFVAMPEFVEVVASNIRRFFLEREALDRAEYRRGFFRVPLAAGWAIVTSDARVDVEEIVGRYEVIDARRKFSQNTALEYQGQVFLDSTGDGVEATSKIIDERSFYQSGSMSFDLTGVQDIKGMLTIRLPRISP